MDGDNLNGESEDLNEADDIYAASAGNYRGFHLLGPIEVDLKCRHAAFCPILQLLCNLVAPYIEYCRCVSLGSVYQRNTIDLNPGLSGLLFIGSRNIFSPIQCIPNISLLCSPVNP